MISFLITKVRACVSAAQSPICGLCNHIAKKYDLPALAVLLIGPNPKIGVKIWPKKV